MRFLQFIGKPGNGWIFPVILLFLGLFSITILSTIPVADGYGWDGVKYGNIAMHFEELMSSRSLNQYYAGRIFPAVLIFYVYKIANLPLTSDYVLIGYQVYNLLILFLSGIVFNLIAKELKWDYKKKIIGFIALFINYPVLNFHFYYPVLTDSTAFILSLILLYAYLKNNSVLILVASVIGFFTWPTIFIIGIVLFTFSISNTRHTLSYYDNKTRRIQSFVLFLLITFPILFYLLYFNVHNFIPFLGLVKKILIVLNLDSYIPLNYTNIQEFSDRLFTLSGINLLTATLFNIIYYWLLLSIFINKLNLKKLIKGLLIKPILISFITIFILYIGLIWFRNEISYLEDKFSLITLFRNIPGYSVKLIGQFIIAHISYFGPFLLFIIFYLKGYLYYISRNNLAISFIFIFLILFSITTESRHLINLYPFFVLFFVNWFDFNLIKRFNLFATTLLILSILYSKIWFPINLPSTSFPDSIWNDLDKFPMQYYFMNHGPWQNTEMYLLHLYISLVVFILLFFFLPKEKQKRLQIFFSFKRIKKII